MKFQRRRGVSVIIATLLLIAIAVAAGILVYVFVNGLAGSLTTGGGQQTTERLQMQSFNFALSPQACACTSQILQIFLQNSGSSSTTISSVYYDGNLLTLATPVTAATLINSIGYPAVAGNAYTAPTSTLVNDLTATSCTATPNGAAATMCLGSLFGFALFMVNVVLRWTHFHFLYAAPILTVLDAAILVAVSLRNPAPAEASIDVSMWRLDFSRAEQLRLKLLPLWQDFRFQAAALLALTAAVVIAFR